MMIYCEKQIICKISQPNIHTNIKKFNQQMIKVKSNTHDFDARLQGNLHTNELSPNR